VLVSGEGELVRVLSRVYGAMGLPFRPASVGSLRRAGGAATVEEAMGAFVAEAAARYGAERVPLDEKSLGRARAAGEELLVSDPDGTFDTSAWRG
jgi:hypothetical protein